MSGHLTTVKADASCCRLSSFIFQHLTSRLPTASAGLIALAVALLAYPLRAQPIQDSIVVTAHPSGPLGDTAEDVNVVTGQELQTAASPALDHALRGVPGFGLFRRTGSREANPRAQGVPR